MFATTRKTVCRDKTIYYVLTGKYEARNSETLQIKTLLRQIFDIELLEPV